MNVEPQADECYDCGACPCHAEKFEQPGEITLVQGVCGWEAQYTDNGQVAGFYTDEADARAAHPNAKIYTLADRRRDYPGYKF
jgi:hypothetical protein